MQATVVEMAPRLEEIDPVVISIRDMARQWLSTQKVAALELALSEALANAVKHGLSPEFNVPVRITLEVRPEEIWLEVVDAGEPGPANLFKNVARLEDIDPMAENGRGLSLIRHCTDALRFEPRQGRNHLELVFLKDLDR